MTTNAFVGFSVNPELKIVAENTPGPKKVLQSFEVELSGSSGDVDVALRTLGTRSKLLGLVGAGAPSVSDSLLLQAVQESGTDFVPIKVLQATNISVLPVIGDKNDIVVGKRNQVLEDKISAALTELKKLSLDDTAFAVVTGLRMEETPFAAMLLSLATPGFRVLNAKDTLCAKAEFEKVLSGVDMLVLNQLEFKSTGKTLSELHGLGPRIILVTRDKRGGFYSVKGVSKVQRFAPVSFPGGVYDTGAGDWFLGAVISELVRLGQSIYTVEVESMNGVVRFAATVAGKKVTMAGSSCGPSRGDL